MDVRLSKGLHYYMLMRQAKCFFKCGDDKYYMVDNSAPTKWVECEVIDDSNGFIEFKPLEEGYLNIRRTRLDILDSLRRGYIVEATPDVECSLEEWEEPLTCNINLHHSAWVLKIGK